MDGAVGGGSVDETVGVDRGLKVMKALEAVGTSLAKGNFASEGEIVKADEDADEEKEEFTWSERYPLSCIRETLDWKTSKGDAAAAAAAAFACEEGFESVDRKGREKSFDCSLLRSCPECVHFFSDKKRQIKKTHYNCSHPR